jgi:excisionase family DNA binding protein
MSNRLALNVNEAAGVANVGPAKIRQEIKSGRLVARRAGKLILITPEDLRLWLDNLPMAAAA